MKSTVKILLSVLVLGALSCSPKGDGSVSEILVNGDKMFTFSLSNLKSDTATVLLSSLLENYAIVQLENIDEAYSNPWFTSVTDKYIGVRQQGSRPYKLFDHSGKFLCNVGAVGHGPGEYSLSLYDDIIDEKNELVYLAPFIGNRILVYNTSGSFVKEFVAPHNLNKPKISLTDNILTVIHYAFPNNSAIAIQFDVNTGEILKELAPPSRFVVQSFEGEIWNTKNVPGVFDFAYTSSDTLYHFDSKNNQIKPFFTMTHDETKRPFIQYLQLNKDLLVTYVFKVGLIATDLNNKTSSFIEVIDDYSGNMATSANIMTFRNGFYVKNIQPEILMDQIEKRLDERDCTESDKQKLQKLLSTLQEESNNVVILGKVKNNIQAKLF